MRVLGEFPLSDDDVIKLLDLIEKRCRAVHVKSIRDAEEVWGLDVAQFGNCRTALAKRRGNHLVEPIKAWAKRDLMEVAGLVRYEYERARIKPDVIFVDSIGLGAGVVDRMKEMGLPVKGINVGETPSGKDLFKRLRDELWWQAWKWTATCRTMKS